MKNVQRSVGGAQRSASLRAAASPRASEALGAVWLASSTVDRETAGRLGKLQFGIARAATRTRVAEENVDWRVVHRRARAFTSHPRDWRMEAARQRWRLLL